MEVLGPTFWAILHRYASRWCGDAAAAERWLRWFERILPCEECRRHWAAMLTQHPPVLTTRDDFFAWTVTVHNRVNVRLGKPVFSLAAAKHLHAQALAIRL